MHLQLGGPSSELDGLLVYQLLRGERRSRLRFRRCADDQNSPPFLAPRSLVLRATRQSRQGRSEREREQANSQPSMADNALCGFREAICASPSPIRALVW